VTQGRAPFGGHSPEHPVLAGPGQGVLKAADPDRARAADGYGVRLVFVAEEQVRIGVPAGCGMTPVRGPVHAGTLTVRASGTDG
jgi:hypothetical protein